MSENSGGSAFPTKNALNRDGNVMRWAQDGMSVRCWLVGHILEGMSASPELMQWLTAGTMPPYETTMAQAAIRLADAVIAELGEEE